MNTTLFLRQRDEALRATRNSEERYKRLIDSVSDYVYTVRVENGRALSTCHGAACEAVTGYTSAELEADPGLWLRMVHEDDRQLVLDHTDSLLNCQVAPALEHRIVHKNGSVRWIRNSAVPRWDTEGGLAGYDGVVSDITERKIAEESLRRERILMRTVLDNLPDIIYAKDLAGRKTLTNRADLRMMGCRSESDALGKTDFEFYPVAAASRLFADDQQVIQTGRPVLDREEFSVDEKGQPRWVVTSKLPLRDQSGQIVGLVGISRNITERKLAQQALRDSEERLGLVIQGSNDGIWDWNLVTNQVYFSPRWKSMLGYADDEVQDHVSAWEELIHPEDRKRAFARIQNYLSGKEPTYELEHRLRHKDGTYRWILARGVAQREADGKPVRLVGSHIDLTERKLAIEQLRHAYTELARNEDVLKATMEELKASNDQLKAAQLQLIQAAKLETVGTLAAGVAHEVKNPLQTLLMGIEFLNRNLSGAGQDVPLVLADMREAITRANSIISELLQLSAARDFDMRPQSVNELIERALYLINNEVVASRTKVSLSLAPEAPQARIDRVKIEQVLINLFMNALQAMSQEGVLSVRTRVGRLGGELPLEQALSGRFSRGDRVVVIEVQDTGTGIPEANMARIFDPFFTTKTVGEGTGLGLSVVRQIVDLHGGAIAIKNASEGGVLVTLVLKAEWKDEAEKGILENQGAKYAQQEEDPGSGRRSEHNPLAETEPGANERIRSEGGERPGVGTECGGSVAA